MTSATLEFGPLFRAMRRNKVRIGLIVVEIGLTLAIVSNCSSLIFDARRQMTHASGFDDPNLLSIRTVPFDPAFKEDGYLEISRQTDVEALRQLPGVRAVSNTRFLPWQGGANSTELRAAGSQGEMLRTQIYNADEGTVDVLGVRLTSGHNFTREEVDADVRRLEAALAHPRPRGDDGLPLEKLTQDVLVTQAFARLAFGEGEHLGRLLEDADGDMYRIVGVVDPFYNPCGWPIQEYAAFFMSHAASYAGGTAFLVRAEPGRVAEVAKAAEERLMAVNGGRNLKIQTIEDVKALYFGPQRLVTTLMGGVVFLLVLVTSIGIVGLTSFSVTERTRQIGTRRALGARRSDILRHFLLENWLVTSMGLVLGVLAAYGMNVGLVTVASGAKLDLGLVAGGAVLLWAAGLLATLAPALRAARTSPAIATRNV